MRVIDLSHFIEEGMPVYPGTEPPKIRAACTVAQCGFYERKLEMFSHTGTHMDAPVHMLEQGQTLDQYDVSNFLGHARLLDVSGFAGQRVPLEYVKERDLSGAGFVLLRSGWDRYWGQEAYFRDYPVLTLQAAEYLAGLGLKGLGVDMISVDPTEPPETGVHHTLFEAGMVLVENLCNLAWLPDYRPFMFSALPLKLKGADGSPLRVAALL